MRIIVKNLIEKIEEIQSNSRQTQVQKIYNIENLITTKMFNLKESTHNPPILVYTPHERRLKIRSNIRSWFSHSTISKHQRKITIQLKQNEPSKNWVLV